MNARYESRDLQFLELFADYGLDDAFSSVEVLDNLLNSGVSYRVFQAFIKRYNFHYNSLSLEARLQGLRYLVEGGASWAPEDILLILPEAEHLDYRIVQISMENSCALLHSFALLLAWRLVAKVARANGELCSEEKKHFGRLIHDCVRNESSILHHIEPVWSVGCGYADASPFSSIIWSLMGEPRRLQSTESQFFRALESFLITWITILSSNGVDLLDYGRQERRLYEQGHTTFLQRFRSARTWMRGAQQRSLFGIRYGPRPEHWRLWWVVEYEEYAGEFWDLVDSQSMRMPGSWVDEPWSLEDFEDEERRRLFQWNSEETTPLIWSEYRKVRPPV